MSHIEADKHSTIRAILLLRTVLQIDEAERLIEECRELLGDMMCVADIPRRQRVIVERDSINHGDQKKRPVRASLSNGWRLVVIDWEEDVRCICEIWKGVLFAP